MADEGRVLRGGWVAYHDATHDREYFYHAESGERSWTPPTPAKLGISTVTAVAVSAVAASTWEAKVDPKTKRTYYVNLATKKSVWKKPADYVEEIAVEAEAEPEEAVEEKAAAAVAAVWRAVVDPATKRTYYVHNTTHESVWETPADYVAPSGAAAVGATKDDPVALDDGGGSSVWSTGETDSVVGESAALRVFARFRPIASGTDEAAAFLFDSNNMTVEIVKLGVNPKFTFDRVFNNASQAELQAAIGSPAVREVLRGFNSTIFAYGQTGSGKTFSMFGPAMDDGAWTPDPATAGIIPRATQLLFREIGRAPEGTEFVIRISMLEIYNETVNDLLEPTRKNLNVRETARAGVWVDKLTTECVTSSADVYRAIQRGSLARSVASTKMNAESSRSHVVMTLVVEQRRADGSKLVAKLNLVDLAGSENVKLTGAVGKTFNEGKKINLSLTILGQCMARLSSGGGAKGQHVPFRNSKLTHLLKESLGGNTKTFLLIAARSDSRFVTDTTSTLRFGQRAKRIKTKVTATKVAGVGALTRELNAVKKKLAAAETENKSLLKKLAHVAQGGSAAPGTKHLVSLWQDRADSASAAGEVQRLKEQVVSLESKLRVAEKQQREGGNARLAELRVELDGLEHTKTELARELEALKSNLGAAERYGEDLLAQLNESEKARAKAREELALAAASGDSTTAAVAELQSRTAAAEASAAESLRALEETRMKVADSTESNLAITKQLELHKKWVEDARAKWGAESARAKAVRASLAEEVARGEALQRACDASDGAVAQLREQKVLVEAELSSSRTEVDAMQRQIDASALELQRTAQRMEEKAASAEQRADVAAAGASSTNARLEQQQMRAAAAEAALKEERARFETLSETHSAAQLATARNTEAAAQRLRAEAAARAAESARAADALRELEQRLTTQGGELRETVQKQLAGEAYASGLESQLDLVEKRTAALQTSLQETSATAQLSATGQETLRSKLATRAAAAAAAQTEAAQSARAHEAESAARATAEAKAAHYESQLQEQLAWAETARAHVAKQGEAAAESEAALQATLATTREGLRSAQSELERAQLAHRRAADELTASTATVADLESRNVELESALEKVGHAARAATSDGETLAGVAEERSKALLRQEAETQKTAAALSAAEAECASKSAALLKATTTLSRLQNFVKQQRLQKEHSEAAAASARAQLEALRAELSEQKRAIEAVDAQREAAVNAGEDQRNDAEELRLEVEALQANDAQQNAYAESMQSQLTESESRNSELRSKLERIEVEVRDAQEVKKAMADAAASGDANAAVAGMDAARKAAERRAQGATFEVEELRRSLEEAQMHATKAATTMHGLEDRLEAEANRVLDLQQQLLSIHHVYKLQQEADDEDAYRREHEAASLELARRIHATPSPRASMGGVADAAGHFVAPASDGASAPSPPLASTSAPAPAPPSAASEEERAAAVEREYQRDLDLARTLALEETYYAGQLLKLSTRDQWQPRWLVLRGDILDYYHKQSDKRKRGSLALTSESSVAMTGGEGVPTVVGGGAAFDITLQLNGVAPLVLRAKGAHEQQQWFNALQRAITHAHHAPPVKPKQIVRSVSSGSMLPGDDDDLFSTPPPALQHGDGGLPSASSSGRRSRRSLVFRGARGARGGEASPSISTHTGMAGAEPGDYVDLDQLHLTATASSSHTLRSFSCTRLRTRRLSLMPRSGGKDAADEHALVITSNPPRLLILKFDGSEEKGAAAAAGAGRARGKGKVKGAVLLASLASIDALASVGGTGGANLGAAAQVAPSTQISFRVERIDGYKKGPLNFVLTDGSAATDVLHALQLALPSGGGGRSAGLSPARARPSRPSASPAAYAAPSEYLRVAVPPGAVAGTTLKIQAPNGSQLLIKVPAGVVPGQLIKVRVPGLPPSAPIGAPIGAPMGTPTTPMTPMTPMTPPPPPQQEAAPDVSAHLDMRWDGLVGQALEMGFDFELISAAIVAMRAEGAAPSPDLLIGRLTM